IQNTGSCLLNFRFSLTDVLEGDISRLQDTFPARFPKKGKGKAEKQTSNEGGIRRQSSAE
ncbi:unnamed protein product, partial [Heterotrigona itama]